jgi:hypothetical protein
MKAHQHSAGAAGGYDENIGKSRAGNTSKVHLAVNAYRLRPARGIHHYRWSHQ